MGLKRNHTPRYCISVSKKTFSFFSAFFLKFETKLQKMVVYLKSSPSNPLNKYIYDEKNGEVKFWKVEGGKV